MQHIGAGGHERGGKIPGRGNSAGRDMIPVHAAEPAAMPHPLPSRPASDRVAVLLKGRALAPAAVAGRPWPG
jgi:hypothetical protein